MFMLSSLMSPYEDLYEFLRSSLMSSYEVLYCKIKK